MSRDEDAEGRVGRVLSDRYRLDSVLGEGGMGAVYAGTHLKLDRKVAVKVLRRAFARESSALDRFYQEARAAASVESSGVVQVTDLDVDADVGPYLVMERLQGEPLTDILRRGALSPEESIALIGELLDVLAAVHAHDIVHRDLKPANVFLHRDEKGQRVLKVLDFGIAKVQQRHLTMTGEIVGTPRFMSPEQARGEALDRRTNLYAAGLLLYSCLCGEPPFASISGSRVLKHITEGPEPLRQLKPDLPEALHRVVERALAPDPDDRFASAAEMAVALRAALDAPDERSGPASAPLHRKQTPFVLLAVAFVVLGVALGLGVWAFNHGP